MNVAPPVARQASPRQTLAAVLFNLDALKDSWLRQVRSSMSCVASAFPSSKRTLHSCVFNYVGDARLAAFANSMVR
jgi:hypothetical protein